MFDVRGGDRKRKGVETTMDKFSETRMLQNGEPPKRKPGRPRIHPLPEEAATEDPVVETGISCPVCGSSSSYVYKSTPVTGGRRKRQRVCQACRRTFETFEE